MSAPLVEARSVRRTFRVRSPGLRGLVGPTTERVALAELDLCVHSGERVALVGPNGAGKSTTVKLLCGLLRPSSGSLLVGGQEPHRNRQSHVRRLGVVFGQRTQLWWDLSVADGLAVLGRLHCVSDGGARRQALVERMGVGSLLSQRVRTLSLGQRARCEIVAALQHAPQLLLLDEPTIGLDVAARMSLREALRDACDVSKTTLIMASHDLEDVRTVCERVVILADGQVAYDGSLDLLPESESDRRKITFELDQPLADASVLQNRLGQSVHCSGRIVVVHFSGPAGECVRAVVSAVTAAGARIEDVRLEEPGLDARIARLCEGPE